MVTVFFEALSLEVNCYDYGEVGHFLDEGLGISPASGVPACHSPGISGTYLGESFCSREEVALSELTAFPPLNYCCYPSVSKEYIVPREEPWTPNKEALAVMEGMAEKVEIGAFFSGSAFIGGFLFAFWPVFSRTGFTKTLTHRSWIFSQSA